ncbi:hypothetical protein N9C66_08500 [Akkermansiaceae bacterium]|nr:hypothetical protein [Akkermansiaceae bacterium]MDB4393364.1 hypothetical protein [bacterium]MDA7929569.1 hypothetical protein [Akkermansiaceae bacterium]MDA9831369.1 hypothetical protein [Akkermansiaceae bacterium]MDB4383240.1 hypothetical protein [Akkermansiaceae bacterium]
MRTSLIAGLTMASLTATRANDQVSLKNGDLFFGKVIALTGGLIELQTPHSESPLKIVNEDLIRLNFSGANAESKATEELPKNSQELFLRNGDSIPGEVVGLTSTHLSFQTWFTGLLEIPREQIDSVFFGVTPQRNVFRGPVGIEGWSQGNNGRWRYEDGTLTSRDKGFIGRDLQLPKNFIFSTEISWESSPNIRIHLCTEDPEPQDDGTSNSYLLNLNSGGIQVKRVMPAGARGPKFQTLITSSQNLQNMSSKSCQIELRVDRTTKILQLYLDGEKLGQGVDPTESPEGSSLLLESLSSGSSDNNVSNIMVHEWDTTTQLLRREPRAEDELDTLSVDDGDRFSGEIISYDPTLPTKPFTVKTPLSPDPITIPLENCAVMYFTKGENSRKSTGQYNLALRTGGKLTLSGIQLGAEKLKANHPWLGKLEIDRRVMQSISKGK